MFVCTKCGLCCKNLDKVPELSMLHRGDGVCIHLSNEKLCDIYQNRPDICNVEKMYELRYKDRMSQSEYEKMNMEGCRTLQRKMNKEL